MTPRQARLGVDVFTAAVVTSVAFALANLTWRLTGEPGIGPAAAPVMARGGESVDITQLVALSPFGTSAAAVQPGTGDGAVTLKAVFLAYPAEASVVLLASTDGKVASYGIGSAVGGGVIESIEAEQITIRTNGGLQKIGFNPANAGTPVSGQTVAVVPGNAPVTVTVGAAPVPRPAAGADAIRALIPPSVQGREVAPAPAAAGAPAASGYRVSSSVPPALSAAGVRAGDVIQRVNGQTVGSGVNLRDIASNAFASGSAQVEVVRDGQRISLTVPAR